MYVGQNCGLTSTPSFTGGIDYAQGGARVQLAVAAGSAPACRTSRSPSRSDCSSRKGPLDPNALYQIQGGANDIFVLANQFLGGQITQAAAAGAVVQAATDLAAQVVRLRAGGAQYIILQTLPDIGKTPVAASLRRAGAAVHRSSPTLFNTTLERGHRAPRACR